MSSLFRSLKICENHLIFFQVKSFSIYTLRQAFVFNVDWLEQHNTKDRDNCLYLDVWFMIFCPYACCLHLKVCILDTISKVPVFWKIIIYYSFGQSILIHFSNSSYLICFTVSLWYFANSLPSNDHALAILALSFNLRDAKTFALCW